MDRMVVNRLAKIYDKTMLMNLSVRKIDCGNNFEIKGNKLIFGSHNFNGPIPLYSPSRSDIFLGLPLCSDYFFFTVRGFS